MKSDDGARSSFSGWINFIGTILVLLGIYGSVRTSVNAVAFQRYPTAGVFSLNFGGFPVYGQTEEDCELSVFYGPMTDSVGSQFPPEDAKKDQDRQKQSCMRGVATSREQARVNDISQSSLFLFLGIGIFVSRKFLFRTS